MLWSVVFCSFSDGWFWFVSCRVGWFGVVGLLFIGDWFGSCSWSYVVVVICVFCWLFRVCCFRDGVCFCSWGWFLVVVGCWISWVVFVYCCVWRLFRWFGWFWWCIFGVCFWLVVVLCVSCWNWCWLLVFCSWGYFLGFGVVGLVWDWWWCSKCWYVCWIVGILWFLWNYIGYFLWKIIFKILWN